MQIWGAAFIDINGWDVQGFWGSLFTGKFKALKLELAPRKVKQSHLGLHAQVFLKENLHGWLAAWFPSLFCWKLCLRDGNIFI